MIIAIQGYNEKKNRSVLATACLSGMTALAYGTKTLVIQLVNNDTNAVENMMSASNQSANTFGREESTLANECIDNLLSGVSGTRLTEENFTTNCTPMFKTDKLLDVVAISKNKLFTTVLVNRLPEVKRIIESATEYYDHIYMLLPTSYDENNRQAVKELNEMADKSIYCLIQGRKLKQDELFGRDIIYLLMDYESESQFSVKATKKLFCESGQRMYKINHNVACNDASMSGELLEFIRSNRDLSTADVNYDWSEDVKRIVKNLINVSEKEEVLPAWEKITGENAMFANEASGVHFEPSPCREYRKGLFQAKKTVPSHSLGLVEDEYAQDTDGVEELESIEANEMDVEEFAEKEVDDYVDFDDLETPEEKASVEETETVEEPTVTEDVTQEDFAGDLFDEVKEVETEAKAETETKTEIPEDDYFDEPDSNDEDAEAESDTEILREEMKAVDEDMLPAKDMSILSAQKYCYIESKQVIKDANGVVIEENTHKRRILAEEVNHYAATMNEEG